MQFVSEGAPCFSCICSTLLKNSSSNKTFVGVDSIRSSFRPFGNQQNPSRTLQAFFLFNFICEYLKVIFISLLDFYHHIRTATLQNSKLHHNFSDKLHILNTNNIIIKSCALVLNNSKIRYKDKIQVCFTSL